jgi:hypothetical protein
LRVIVRDEPPDDNDTTNVEEQYTVEDSTNSFRHIAAGILSFASCEGYNFSAKKTERRIDECCPEGKKAAFGSRNAVKLVERARVLPITETDAVMRRSTTKIEDNPKDYKANNLMQY